MKEEIRSCHKSLTSILAPQVKQDEALKVSVMAKIKNTMLAVTEYSYDMSALLQATIVKHFTHPEADSYTCESLREGDERNRILIFFFCSAPRFPSRLLTSCPDLVVVTSLCCRVVVSLACLHPTNR
ncbi:hypothetical protein DM01DRAFT_1134223 [Hesseltinella vesiculosa]|uniref:Uncharacterized protein n=1 Tax=Hesseltinella vesiculosa TaxID=101127 RepID=A0A1X2G8S7_9FUNG|nr:hypothetical protein DM01DRAFT_1134223 [Hesseltinella vesiculosa]